MDVKNWIILSLLTITAVCSVSAIKMEPPKEEKDFAVPAFSDFFVLGGTRISVGELERPGPGTALEQISWLDINRDFTLNDFDVKQFEALTEKLKGNALEGSVLVQKFKDEQKKNKDSFPLLYDLDRDGKFTPYDTDYFAELVERLGGLKDKTEKLTQKFREAIFPS